MSKFMDRIAAEIMNETTPEFTRLDKAQLRRLAQHYDYRHRAMAHKSKTAGLTAQEARDYHAINNKRRVFMRAAGVSTLVNYFDMERTYLCLGDKTPAWILK